MYQLKKVCLMSTGRSFGVGKLLKIFPFSFKLSSDGLLMLASDSFLISLKFYANTKTTLLFKSLIIFKSGKLSAFTALILDFLSLRLLIIYIAKETLLALTFLLKFNFSITWA